VNIHLEMRMRRSPQNIDDIKTQIAQAALRIGPNLDGFSVQELAQSANVAIGTIYRVLPTKAELKTIVNEYVEQSFNRHIFAPIRAKYDLKARFELVFARLIEYIELNKHEANYLAMYGIANDAQFKKAIYAFIDEASSIGVIDKALRPIAMSLIWGPILSLLQTKAQGINHELLCQSVWAALKA
jgi:AcrR family transcriptional regulator